MKQFQAVLASILLAGGVLACGSSNGNTITPGTSTSATSSHHKKDRDQDEDHNDDDYHILGFGHIANASDNQTITNLINHYFTIAVAGNGAKACSLLTPFIAESVVEVYGSSPLLRGNSCATIMSKLFKQHHLELVSKRAGLKVMRIGIEGNRSLVALAFTEIPVVRELTLRKVNDKWTVMELLDGLME